ncbi:hypothetical protein L210DRAFT_977879 [Boletus edulis BED1]|uniref:Uncharacterized protein n=1 Tax=Boletus edulis BED1 TaxID=1328754 RepID=A0AAD4G6T0_BOLED|nr:hypothetical protein L210DRAFT_977879 [Boletus edulis BED1]
MPRGSLVTQNDAVPRLGPRRCLNRASTRPCSPLPLPAIACTPSPRPTCTDTITHLLTCTARLSFTLARIATPHRPTSCAPRPCPCPVLARTSSHSQKRCGDNDNMMIVTA